MFGQLVSEEGVYPTLDAMERVPNVRDTTQPIRPIKLLEAQVFDDPFEEYMARRDAKMRRERPDDEEKARREMKRRKREEDRTTWYVAKLPNTGWVQDWHPRAKSRAQPAQCTLHLARRVMSTAWLPWPASARRLRRAAELAALAIFVAGRVNHVMYMPQAGAPHRLCWVASDVDHGVPVDAEWCRVFDVEQPTIAVPKAHTDRQVASA